MRKPANLGKVAGSQPLNRHSYGEAMSFTGSKIHCAERVRIKKRGISQDGAVSPIGVSAMSSHTRELDRPLEANAIRDIERALWGKLRACGLSDAFIHRSIEDALQKGLEEYLRRARSVEIENPMGFVVRAGFQRAIDELRREARQADGDVVDVLIDSTSNSEPSTDELAIGQMEADELRQAVDQLSPEEQQVLSLHYFEELTAEASAATLFCSERTYRRRLKQALRKLSRLLGGPVPEPGSELALEIGVIAWIGLGGAKVVLSHGLLDQLLAGLEAGHERLRWLEERVRELVGLSGASGGGSERIVAVASSGPGKAVGACVAAAAACVLAVGGAELAGVGGGGSTHSEEHPPAPASRVGVKQQSPPKIVTAPPAPAPASGGGGGKSAGTSGAAESGSESQREKTKKANEGVRSQSPESAAGESPSVAEETSPPVVEATPTPVPSESTPNGVVRSQSPEGSL
jgi:RNA polymerase sigma factor (sigma-70 family)